MDESRRGIDILDPPQDHHEYVEPIQTQLLLERIRRLRLAKMPSHSWNKHRNSRRGQYCLRLQRGHIKKRLLHLRHWPYVADQLLADDPFQHVVRVRGGRLDFLAHMPRPSRLLICWNVCGNLVAMWPPQGNGRSTVKEVSVDRLMRSKARGRISYL